MLVPQPDGAVGIAPHENQIVLGAVVAAAGDGELDAEAAGRSPAGIWAARAIAPDLVIEAHAEQLVVAAGDGFEPAAGPGPGGLVPQPEGVIRAAEENQVVGGIAVAGVREGDLGAPAAGGGPAGGGTVDAIAP